jgi:hypothetical protein
MMMTLSNSQAVESWYQQQSANESEGERENFRVQVSDTFRRPTNQISETSVYPDLIGKAAP